MTTVGTFIAEHDGLGRADRVIERIKRAMDNLAFMPGLGRGRPYLDPGALAFSCAPWVIIYALKPDKSGIDILRVIDGRRDLPSIFGDKT